MSQDDGESGWTVGDLRQALEGVPDSLPINVNVVITNTRGDRDGFLPFRIDSGAVSMTNVGDESAPEPYSYFEINLEDVEDGVLLYVPYPPV